MTRYTNRNTAGAVALLKSEILAWIEEHTELLSNERDIQVKLAKFLEQRGAFDKVFTEYRVPLSELKARGVPVEPNSKLAGTRKVNPAFPWNNQMSVDIVVEKNGQYAALELKYATHPVVGVEMLFGEAMLTDAKILKDQAATNVTMYSYWKDVRRIEMLTSIYDKVTGGIALMIANNHDYWFESSPTAKYARFSMHEHNVVGPGLLDWNGTPSAAIVTGYPAFILDGAYPCHWDDTNITLKSDKGDKFRYFISEITN